MVSIHIDADDAEVYGNVDPRDKKLKESFIVAALTNALAMLNETNTKAVVFVVGKNLKGNPQYQELLRQFIKEGHAIGNHSFSHAEDFHSWGKEAQVQDVRLADSIIRESLSCKPLHFRGPGYSTNHGIQFELLNLGYLFDCTKIPLLYSSGLDLYFKVIKKSKKNIPSVLRAKDIFFAFAKPIRGIEEQLIHPNKFWGIPIYSTWIFRKKNQKQIVTKQIQKAQVPFLFHAIDFLDYSNEKSSIPALRIHPDERFRIIRNILFELKARDF
jgi:peptidoglycan/xylan/chitin deacetylase (PgdA/CDA1 family)